MKDDLKRVFARLSRRQDLSRDQSRRTFESIMNGGHTDASIGALLAALAVKGECVEEILGAADAMRSKFIPISCGPNAIDTCGTGGDGISTFNVSTTAAIIAASAGATVAKHGNCSMSRASGSTEVLQALGIDVDANPPVVERCLETVRIGYLNARKLHPAMSQAATVRQDVPIRTILNLLGPLTNPARVSRQIVGVPNLELLNTMAQVLLELGVTHAWVVHGQDGLCDMTVTWSTTVAEVRDQTLRKFSISPEQVGLQRGSLTDLLIDSPAASAAVIRGILRGRRGTAFDHAMMNAGAALVVAGIAFDLRDGIAMATRAIDDGAAWATLESWRAAAGPEKAPCEGSINDPV